MKNIIIILQLLCFSLLSQTCPTSCDYYDPVVFPSQLTLENGDTLCITSDYVTTWTSISVESGGVISICDSSTLLVNGSLSVNPGGKILLNGCMAKLEIYGTYNGGYNTCEMELHCPCEGATSPIKLNWGVKVWDDWCCMSTLPVELVSFTGVRRQSNIVLNWITASEVNNQEFIIEKSKDLASWEELARVDGTNTNITTSYSYVEVGSPELYYYRLTQVDYDGTASFSNIIAINKYSGNVNEKYRTNLLGVIVSKEYKGVVIIIYTDDSARKGYQR